MSEVIPNIIDIHGYADDHAIKTLFQSESKISETEAVNVMENTLASIRSWMSENRLKINDSKTEFIIYGSRQQFKNLSIDSLKVNQTSVTASDFIKYLWVYLDQNLNLKKHITAKCPVASINLYRIRNILKYLTKETCTVFMLGLVLVHLDYANSLFVGLPQVDISRLQRIQNMEAKVILGRSKRDSATQCLKELHWLPVHLRIEYKLITTVYKCLHNQAPDYLKEMIKRPTEVRATRSSLEPNRLVIPVTKKKTFAERSFSVAGPRLWNKLPPEIRSLSTYEVFKKHLKTYLYIKF